MGIDETTQVNPNMGHASTNTMGLPQLNHAATNTETALDRDILDYILSHDDQFNAYVAKMRHDHENMQGHFDNAREALQKQFNDEVQQNRRLVNDLATYFEIETHGEFSADDIRKFLIAHPEVLERTREGMMLRNAFNAQRFRTVNESGTQTVVDRMDSGSQTMSSVISNSTQSDMGPPPQRGRKRQRVNENFEVAMANPRRGQRVAAARAQRNITIQTQQLNNTRTNGALDSARSHNSSRSNESHYDL